MLVYCLIAIVPYTSYWTLSRLALFGLVGEVPTWDRAALLAGLFAVFRTLVFVGVVVGSVHLTSVSVFLGMMLGLGVYMTLGWMSGASRQVGVRWWATRSLFTVLFFGVAVFLDPGPLPALASQTPARPPPGLWEMLVVQGQLLVMILGDRFLCVVVVVSPMALGALLVVFLVAVKFLVFNPYDRGEFDRATRNLSWVPGMGQVVVLFRLEAGHTEAVRSEQAALPESERDIHALALLALEDGDHESARAFFEQVYEDQQVPDTMAALAMLLGGRDPDEALEIAQTMEENQSMLASILGESRDAHYAAVRGLIAASKGEEAAARVLIESEVTLPPLPMAELHHLRTEVLRALQDPAWAEEARRAAALPGISARICARYLAVDGLTA